MWAFLSAWSDLYGVSADAGFLRQVSAKIQGANTSMRRCTGAALALFRLPSPLCMLFTAECSC